MSQRTDPEREGLLADLRAMRDFCHARHLRGVDCDQVLARVEQLLAERKPQPRWTIRNVWFSAPSPSL